jgi:diguanylate cyclase (GGDEF)-like protein/PAS domain S-box-containing protein
VIGNILIVDDEPTSLKLLQTLLAADGHVVRPFTNAELALRSIKAKMPELIVMDIRMPGMNGFEACRIIKQDEKQEEIPVIFISAASDTEDKVKAFEEGAVDYISKPFQKEEVLARVRTQIKLSHTIQRKRKIADELRKSEESLKIAQSIAHLGHWEWDVSSRQFHCSDEMCRILGFAQNAQVIDQDMFLKFVHPDDRSRVASHLASVITENSFDIEFGIVLQDGTKRTVHGKGETTRLSGATQTTVIGTIQQVDECEKSKVLGVIQDITERKSIEVQLRIAAAAFETHDGIMITDVDGNIIKVNQAFSRISGYSPEEVLGQNPRIMNSGRHDKVFFADLFEDVLHKGSWDGEIWDKHKNGEIYPRWVRISAVRDTSNNICQFVGIFSDITDRKKNEELINKMAFYDVLTQLPNRRMLYDRLKLAMAANKRNGVYGAILFIDLDKFKPLNDTHGHVVGDLLLVEVARRIGNCLRDMDTVARFGGDEFVVMLNELNSDETQSRKEACSVADKIRLSLSETYFLGLQQDGVTEACVEHNCSSSIGVTLFSGRESVQEDILKRADIAMYQAKTGGRDSVHFYEHEDQ